MRLNSDNIIFLLSILLIILNKVQTSETSNEDDKKITSSTVKQLDIFGPDEPNDANVEDFVIKFKKKNKDDENTTTPANESKTDSENRQVFLNNMKKYCEIESCIEPHIGCNNDLSYGKKCPTDVQYVEMQHIKKSILEMFNKLRNRIAGGEAPFKPANRMATMQWDNELQFLAELNLRSCVKESDRCHNLVRFRYSGQNRGKHTYKGFEAVNEKELIIDMISSWSEDIAKFPQEEIKKFSWKSKFGTFTILIQEMNTHVGCAALKFKLKRDNVILLTCNFATNNLLDRPIYTIATEPATGCITGKNNYYQNLCSLQEAYDTHKD